MTKIIILQLSLFSILTAATLQDWADKTFHQGKYAIKESPTINKDNNSQTLPKEVKKDYSKASSLQDVVDMMFDQGKYKK
jgi:major membrane immunogen (membrane-anchored lipoprotein)